MVDARSLVGGAHWLPRRVLSGLLALLLLVGLIAGAIQPRVALAQVAALQTAEVTPATAAFYAALPLDPEAPQWQQATVLAERAGFGDLFGQLGAEMTGDLAEPTDFATELAPFLGGEVALVVTDFGLAAEGLDVTGLVGDLQVPGAAPAEALPGFAIIVRAPDPDAAYAAVEAFLEEDAAAMGTTIDDVVVDGVTIRFAPGVAEEDGTAIARVGDFVIVATAPEAIEEIIATFTGAVPALAAEESFNTLQAALPNEYLVFGYVNAAALGEEFAAAMTEEFGSPLDLGNFGTASAFVLWADEPGFRIDAVAMPVAGTELPASPAVDLTLAERVPAETLLFVNGSDLGQQGILDVLGLVLVQGINAGGADVEPALDMTEEEAAAQYEQAAQVLGFNLQTDFLQQLIGEYALAVWADVETLDPTGIGALLVSDVAAPATVQDVLSKISLFAQVGAGEGVAVSTREVDGNLVNVVEDTTGALPIPVEYGVIDDQLVLGLGAALEDYVAGPVEALAANPRYVAALAALPEPHTSEVYVDLAQVVTLVEGFTGTMDMTGLGGVEDANPLCADYATQEEAQAAYEADPMLFDLDQDFDDLACEDYFGVGEPAPAELAGVPDLSALQSFAMVGYELDGLPATSAILLIADEEV